MLIECLWNLNENNSIDNGGREGGRQISAGWEGGQLGGAWFVVVWAAALLEVRALTHRWLSTRGAMRSRSSLVACRGGEGHTVAELRMQEGSCNANARQQPCAATVCLRATLERADSRAVAGELRGK